MNIDANTEKPHYQKYTLNAYYLSLEKNNFLCVFCDFAMLIKFTQHAQNQQTHYYIVRRTKKSSLQF